MTWVPLALYLGRKEHSLAGCGGHIKEAKAIDGEKKRGRKGWFGN